MDEQPESQDRRLSTAVNRIATEPGNRLTKAVFAHGDQAWMVDVIEGGPNDTVSFLGMATNLGTATNFGPTRVYGFCVQGSLIEQLKEVRDTPARTLAIRIEMLEGSASPSPFDVQRAAVFFSGEPERGGLDPEAAILRLKLRGKGPPEEGPCLSGWLTNFRPGWLWSHVASSFAASFRFHLEPSAEGTTLNQRVTVELSQGSAFYVDGLLHFSSSISRAALLMPTAPVIASSPGGQM
jgi:hypothetical protein